MGFAAATDLNIETKKNYRMQSLRDFNMDNNDFLYSYYESVEELPSDVNKDGFNPYVSDVISWWSPNPNDEDDSYPPSEWQYLCYQYKLCESGGGGYYQGEKTFTISIAVYFIYPSEERLVKNRTLTNAIWPENYIFSGGGWRLINIKDEKPIGVKVEFYINVSELTKDDNKKSSGIIDGGVTIEGTIYTNILNKKVPLENALVRCLADKSDEYFCDYYSVFSAGGAVPGHYMLCAPPKQSKTPPYTYRVRVELVGETINVTKTTEPLNPGDTTILEFIIGSKNKPNELQQRVNPIAKSFKSISSMKLAPIYSISHILQKSLIISKFSVFQTKSKASINLMVNPSTLTI